MKKGKHLVFLLTFLVVFVLMVLPVNANDFPYTILNNGIPYFDIDDVNYKGDIQTLEWYPPLDELGRCGSCFAILGEDLMPTEPRGNIGNVKPTGWIQMKYPSIVKPNPGYLYNRCHLIGYQLTGENSNKRNLITGTRYLNVEGMLPLEDIIANHIKATHGHVLYRVTPIFEGNNLLASGVQMEAWSMEDYGASICLNTYLPNIQPSIVIDYKTGESKLLTYVLNTKTKKIHTEECAEVNKIKENNKSITHSTKEELISQGYSICKKCNP